MSLTRTIPGSITGKLSITAGGWASLSNDIVFEAKHSPVEMGYEPNVAHIVEQDLLIGKPRLQKLGINLQEITITVKFHHMVKPFKEIKAKLADAAYNATVLQWIWGTGEALGDFVITKWKEKIKKTDEEGLVYATEVELTLKEYAGPGVAEQTGIDAKKAAFANKKTAALNADLPKMNATSVSAISKNVSIVKVENAKLKTKLDGVKKLRQSLAAFKRDALPILSKIKQATNQINSAVAIARNIKNANGIATAAGLVNVASNSMSLALGGNHTVNEISALADTVSQTAGGLDQAAAAHQTVKSWFPSLGL